MRTMKLQFWKSYKIIEVEGISMYPTLKNGWYLIFKQTSIEKIKRKDIILFLNGGKWLIKRIIGLPNEFIQIKDNYLYINDNKLEEEYLNIPRSSKSISQWQLGIKEYVILGDNSKDSLDSRKFGVVNFPNNIYVLKRKFWPIGKN